MMDAPGGGQRGGGGPARDRTLAVRSRMVPPSQEVIVQVRQLNGAASVARGPALGRGDAAGAALSLRSARLFKAHVGIFQVRRISNLWLRPSRDVKNS